MGMTTKPTLTKNKNKNSVEKKKTYNEYVSKKQRVHVN